MQELHSKGLAHCDVKPANLLYLGHSSKWRLRSVATATKCGAVHPCHMLVSHAACCSALVQSSLHTGKLQLFGAWAASLQRRAGSDRRLMRTHNRSWVAGLCLLYGSLTLWLSDTAALLQDNDNMALLLITEAQAGARLGCYDHAGGCFTGARQCCQHAGISHMTISCSLWALKPHVELMPRRSAATQPSSRCVAIRSARSQQRRARQQGASGRRGGSAPRAWPARLPTARLAPVHTMRR